MTGFFEGDKEKAQKAALRLTPSRCDECKRFREARTPRLKVLGEYKSNILIVLDSPSATNDIQAKWLCSAEEKEFCRLFPGDIREECLVTGSNICYAEKRTPKHTECCRNNLFRLLDQRKPNVLILCGENAIKSFLQHRWQKNLDADDHTGNRKKSWNSIVKRWRGIAIPDKEYRCWVICTFSPSDLISDYDNVIPVLVQKDLELAYSKINVEVPIYNPEELLTVATENHALQFLDRIQNNDKLVFDYETSGLKPYGEDQFIHSLSVFSDLQNRCFSFIFTDRIRAVWKEILYCETIKKIAQNAKFEDTWSTVKVGKVRGWIFDTLMGSHYIDNRAGYSGLKFQAYVNFGCIDYSSHLDQYLKAPKGVWINNIRKAPEKELLRYNGLDSIYTYWLWDKQVAQIVF